MKTLISNKAFWIGATLACVGAGTALAQTSQTRSSSDTQSEERNNEYERSYSNNDGDSRSEQNRDRSQRNAERNSAGRRSSGDQYDSRDDGYSNRGGSESYQTRSGYGSSSAAGDEESAALGVVIVSRGGGLQVARVSQDSPARDAGLQVGDEILAIDGRRYQTASQLSNDVRQMNPGDNVEVRIRRDGRTRTVWTRLDERSEVFDHQAQRGRQGEQYRSQEYGQYANQGYGARGSTNSNDTSSLRAEVSQLRQEVRRLSQRIDQIAGGNSYRGNRGYSDQSEGWRDNSGDPSRTNSNRWNRNDDVQSRQYSSTQEYSSQNYDRNNADSRRDRSYDRSRQNDDQYDRNDEDRSDRRNGGTTSTSDNN